MNRLKQELRVPSREERNNAYLKTYSVARRKESLAQQDRILFRLTPGSIRTKSSRQYRNQQAFRVHYP